METIVFLFQAGGPFILFLLGLLIIVLIISVERILFYRSYRQTLTHEISKLRQLKKKSTNDPSQFSADYINHILPELEKYTAILASLSTISPYLGLLGTLGGIIQTFQNIEEITDLVNQGLAASLIATGGGLLIAIVATTSYNYCQHQIQTLMRSIQNL